MKKPLLVIATAIIESLLAAVMISGAIYFYVLWHSIKNPQDAGGLKIATSASLSCGQVAGVASWGLWKNRLWGWLVAMLFAAVALVSLLWDPVIEHDYDPDDIPFIAAFLVVLVMLWLPRVRRFYFRTNKPVWIHAHCDQSH